VGNVFYAECSFPALPRRPALHVSAFPRAMHLTVRIAMRTTLLTRSLSALAHRACPNAHSPKHCATAFSDAHFTRSCKKQPAHRSFAYDAATAAASQSSPVFLPSAPTLAPSLTPAPAPTPVPTPAPETAPGPVMPKENDEQEPPGFHAGETDVYNCPRRLQAVGMSSVAVAQSGFWVLAAYLSATAAEPLISPIVTLGGAGLSALFAGMVNAYLSRSVARISVQGAGAVKLQVTSYHFGGMLRAPRAIETKFVVGGPKGDDDGERYWTFGVTNASGVGTYYYIVDRKKGVVDASAVRALCSTPPGGSALMILAHKRRAIEMKTRWHNWETTTRRQPQQTSFAGARKREQ
jgi:hypothetical protein